MKLPRLALPLLLACLPVTASASTKASYMHYLKALLLTNQGNQAEALKEYEAALELDPQSAFIYEQAAHLALEMGLTDRALGLAKRFTEVDPKNHAAYFLLGNVRWARGELKPAAAAFDRTLQLKPDFKEALFALGNLLSGQDPEKAEKYLKEYLAANPDNAADAEYQIALIEQREGRLDEAAKHLKSSISLEPDNMQARYSLAQVYELRRDTDAALGVYLEILSNNPRNTPLLNRIGETYFTKGNELEAERYFMQAKAVSPGDPAACLWLALLAEQRHDFVSAVRHIRDSSALPEDPALNMRLSYYLTQANRLAEAVTVLERAHQKWPSSQEIAYFLALGYDDLKMTPKAIELLQEVLKIRPDHRDTRFQLGALYEKSGRMQDAESHFREILRANPDDAPTLNYLGYSLADRGQKLPEAEEMLKRAVRLDPKNGAYLDSLGWVHFKEGRNAEALEELKGATRLMPDDEAIWEHLGDIYRVYGDTVSAWEAFKLAQTLSPQTQGLAKKLGQVESLFAPQELAQRLLRFMNRARGNFLSYGGPCAIEGKIAGRSVHLVGILHYKAPWDLTVEVLGPMFVPVFRATVSGQDGFSMDPMNLEGIPQDRLRDTLYGALRMLRDYLRGEVFHPDSVRYHKGWTGFWIDTPEAKLFFDRTLNRLVALKAKRTPGRLSLDNFQQFAGAWVPTTMKLEGKGFSLGFRLQSPAVRFEPGSTLMPGVGKDEPNP